MTCYRLTNQKISCKCFGAVGKRMLLSVLSTTVRYTHCYWLIYKLKRSWQEVTRTCLRRGCVRSFHERQKQTESELKGLILIRLVTVIILIVSSALCTKVKPCELQIALDFIFVKYTSHPCKYNAIKDMSAGFLALGISMLCCTVLLFVPTICLCLLKIEEKKRAYAKIVVSTFWWNRFQYFWFDMIFLSFFLRWYI